MRGEIVPLVSCGYVVAIAAVAIALMHIPLNGQEGSVSACVGAGAGVQEVLQLIPAAACMLYCLNCLIAYKCVHLAVVLLANSTWRGAHVYL